MPGLLPALADGRIHLSTIRLLAPLLTRENEHALIALATHRPKRELEILLAARFPKVEALRLDEGIAALGSSAPRPRVEPLSAMRFSIQLTVSKETHDKLREAHALLRHAIPSADMELVVDRALDALLHVAKKKFAATGKPRPNARPTTNRRHVPAQVRRAVRKRDRGRCTFVGVTGHPCDTRDWLEFDHIVPVAHGGQATVEGIRLRCRTHNQLEAERVFGKAFIEKRRRPG